MTAKRTPGSGSFFWRKLNLTPLLFLSACGSLIPPGPLAPDRYWLAPAPLEAVAAPDAPAVAVELRVVPGLDSDRVLVLGADARLAPLEGASWAEFLPEVLHSVISRSLAAGGYTVRPGGARAGDCRLDLQVTAFFLAENGVGHQAQVAMDGRFECGDRALPLAVRAERAATQGPAPSVAALQSALDECLAGLQEAMNAP